MRMIVAAFGITTFLLAACSGPPGLQGQPGPAGPQGEQGPVGSSGTFDPNQVIANGSAAQNGGFNVSGVGAMGRANVGGAEGAARFVVRGEGPFAGAGTMSTTSAQTPVVNGAGTSFTSEVHVGDLIWVGAEARAVSVITNDTTLTLEKPFNSQLVGGTSYSVQQPVARFSTISGSNAGWVDGQGVLKVPEVQIAGYSRWFDLRIARYHATCASLAAGTYANVAAVSPGPSANFLAAASRLSGNQVCANYVGNNNITGWSCLNVPYVYEYTIASNGSIGTDVRPTWYGCVNPLPDASGGYKWLSSNDTNTVMMACCVHN
ncbi:MAG TPA: hypothetical protein VIG99_30610 [Myxococcaceae bacterium]